MPLFEEGPSLAVTMHRAVLANGLRIVTTPLPATQAVSVNLFVGVGSRSESQRLNGITHFLEHMVFKGTERRPDAIMIAQEIEGANEEAKRLFIDVEPVRTADVPGLERRMFLVYARR